MRRYQSPVDNLGPWKWSHKGQFRVVLCSGPLFQNTLAPYYEQVPGETHVSESGCGFSSSVEVS